MLTLESYTSRRSVETLGIENDRVPMSQSKKGRKENALEGMHLDS
jgi:hypothetical protein